MVNKFESNSKFKKIKYWKFMKNMKNLSALNYHKRWNLLPFVGKLGTKKLFTKQSKQPTERKNEGYGMFCNCNAAVGQSPSQRTECVTKCFLCITYYLMYKNYCIIRRPKSEMRGIKLFMCALQNTHMACLKLEHSNWNILSRSTEAHSKVRL